mgnify:CR=1 FL=1
MVVDIGEGDGVVVKDGGLALSCSFGVETATEVSLLESMAESESESESESVSESESESESESDAWTRGGRSESVERGGKSTVELNIDPPSLIILESSDPPCS